MLDPVFNATFAAKSLSDMASAEIAKASNLLYEKASKAKEKYQQHRFNPDDPIEVLRNNCLSKICTLQHQVVLCVIDADFLRKVMPLLLDHVGNVYEATTTQELRIMDMSLARIENAINSYKREKDRRKNIRMVAVVVSLASLVGISLFLWYGSTHWNITTETTIKILSIPVPVLIWSILGSFSAILYRFTNAGDKELNEPLRWLFARPLTGIIMGVISYLVLKVGLLTIQGSEAGTGIGNPEVIWLIAFLAGFSDRFSESLLRTVVGKFGGDKEGELVSMEMRSTSTTVESHSPYLEVIGERTQGDNPAREVDERLLVDQADAAIPTGTPMGEAAPPNKVKKVETEKIEITQTKTDADKS
ncbi:hypothetical protein ACD591_09115 [Rufibacter glacialis]|uniref:Uncharacterized protein n=1 Tax=Rufibacter glacialis TaxID=1259555 RepID=A0A5M8QC62_9BACT|nr:hypothetical protein [Rufibacter glacialis]KAA6432406.1 hypothetical protein FOE74_14995 [Rufibacter glacialis]